jgi:nitrate/nitrite transporter NarK
LTGWLADQFGGRSPIIFGGASALIAAVVLGLILRWHTRAGMR